MNESYILASQHVIHSEQHLHPDALMLLYMLSLLIRTTHPSEVQLKHHEVQEFFPSSSKLNWLLVSLLPLLVHRLLCNVMYFFFSHVCLSLKT